MPPRPPAQRVRERLSALAGAEVAAALPRGYQRLGSVLVLRLPPTLRPWREAIGRLYAEELGVATVLDLAGGIGGEFRRPQVVRLHGSVTETEVREGGLRYRLDAAEIMFAAGNRTERARVGRLVRPGETVVDLFAGIGYFTLPAARWGRAALVVAVEKNPRAFAYLKVNAEINGVASIVVPVLGDNREADLPRGGADRVFLGLLPDSRPFLPRTLELLRPEGGWLHVHLVVSAPRASEEALRRVGDTLAGAGAEVESMAWVAVKPYGPSRTHGVVDARVRPPR